MKSLKAQLTAWLIGLFTVIALLAGGIAYDQSRKDSNEFLDRQMQTVASSIDEGSLFKSMQAQFHNAPGAGRNMELVMQVWLAKEKQTNTSRPGFDLPPQHHTGFSETVWKGEQWRSYTMVYPDRTVQVSQANSVRLRIAGKAALESLLPVAGLIPLTWLIITLLVNRLFKPLDAMAEAISRRDAATCEPLPAGNLPLEIIPFVDAMNGLLSRLQQTLQFQRQFVADAAHELRTPLMAVQLQIDGVAGTPPAEIDFESRIASLRSGVERATHLVNQLLKMARYESRPTSTRDTVDLSDLLKSCLAELIPLAEQRDIDLGLVHDAPVKLTSNVDDLRVLFTNLIDNAIRYTPQGGRVDVGLSIVNDRAMVSIQDTGPGIPEPLLTKVYERFFRVDRHQVEGSGIGLAIAKAIAHRESARLVLANRTDTIGLLATVQFS
jgi:two-component system OmpR family sensor kinase